MSDGYGQLYPAKGPIVARLLAAATLAFVLIVTAVSCGTNVRTGDQQVAGQAAGGEPSSNSSAGAPSVTAGASSGAGPQEEAGGSSPEDSGECKEDADCPAIATRPEGCSVPTFSRIVATRTTPFTRGRPSAATCSTTTAIGGGMNPFDRFADPGSSEWLNACSAGGQYEYGSGDRVDSGPQFCSYKGSQLGTTHPVGARKSCTSPSPSYDSFFDLSGNVAEWEDSCEKAIDADGADGSDACRTRGGSFNSALAALSWDTVPASALRRDAVSPEVGFRCCAK